MVQYFQATVGKKAVFEAPTLDKLREAITQYYAVYCQEVTQIIRFENDNEIALDESQLLKFNQQIEDEFKEKVEEYHHEMDHIREISSPRLTGRI